jgi:hypothetical protein
MQQSCHDYSCTACAHTARLMLCWQQLQSTTARVRIIESGLFICDVTTTPVPNQNTDTNGTTRNDAAGKLVPPWQYTYKTHPGTHPHTLASYCCCCDASAPLADRCTAVLLYCWASLGHHRPTPSQTPSTNPRRQYSPLQQLQPQNSTRHCAGLLCRWHQCECRHTTPSKLQDMLGHHHQQDTGCHPHMMVGCV